MRTQKLLPNFDVRSTQNRIMKAHFALGSQVGDVAMPEVIRVDHERGRPFEGALSGLNEPNFRKIGTNFYLANRAIVVKKRFNQGVLHLDVMVPVYSPMQKCFKGMLQVKLACKSEDSIDDHRSLEVDLQMWASAVFDGNTYWVERLTPDDEPLEYNPFDYAQALLPATINQPNGDVLINTASLCEFVSEVFRFLRPEDRALYLEIMLQGNRFPKFLHYAASARSHHNKEHELLVHTAETIANVLIKAMVTKPEKRNSKKPPFDLSLALLAALLHDAAKVDEYHRLAHDVYSSNLNCELIGHEQTMLKWIAVACAVSGCYPVDRELQLEHAISAVKKQFDQSGARKRKTPESFVLHEADCASARTYDKGETSVLLVHQFVQGAAE
jgi:hypothetical protein